MSDVSVVLELRERTSVRLNRANLADATAQHIWRHYGEHVDVEFPSLRTGGEWQLTARDWVGYIPLPGDGGISLQPKVPLANLFRMLEYAYRLQSIRFPEGLMDADSLRDFFERLARILAERTLDRIRKGVYRAYCPRERRLPYLRGRLDVGPTLSRPWEVRFGCRYKEQTADVVENQIVQWTLTKLTRSSMSRPEAHTAVQRAHRALDGYVSAVPVGPQACIGRQYNRLNLDYEALHALCRFFLENTGPTEELGGHAMLPFLVNMPRLFELFVAEWLAKHLPSEWGLRDQESAWIAGASGLRYQIDLVLYNAETGTPVCVLDTKYKSGGRPLEDDVAQAVMYAALKDVREAILIYLAALSRELDVTVGETRVRTLTFALDSDLEAAGEAFLIDLFSTQS